MKCPNCNHEIQDDAKFCTVCGANIEEAIKTKEREKQEKLEREAKRKKEIEDKKKLEELRKQEQEKQEQLIKEAEKAEAIRQAKEEGIELEIIDEVPQEEEPKVEEKIEKSEFKIKKEKETTNNKKKKVRIKKNIFQVIFEKLLFIIIVSAIIIGAIYFCYRNNYLPDFAMEKAEEIDLTIQNIINMQKEIDEIEDGKKPSNTNNKDSVEWQVEATIEADNIEDLTDDYSIIIKKNYYGIIDNKEAKIVLEPKYSLIKYSEYKVGDTTAKGIIVKDGEKFYKLNDKFELDGEVILNETNKGTYFYDHHNSTLYYNNTEQICKKVTEKSDNRIEMCTDISIVTKDGKDAKNDLLPDSFTIDFEKSTLGPKGYCNPEKGELIIDCNFKEALDFSEGYAAVKEDEKAGFINEKGEKWKEFSFEETRSVHNKLAFVKANGKWGIVKIN